jgi:transposase
MAWHGGSTIWTLEINLGPNLRAEDAQLIYEQGPEAVVFALLQMAKLVEKNPQSADSISTLSGMKPVYTKLTTPRRRKKPGAKK